MEQYNIGKVGEIIARDYFLKNGYFIIAKNARLAHKEIDIIITKDKEIRLIEVKTTFFIKYKPKNDPIDYISKTKISNILEFIDNYSLILNKNKENIYVDLVAIYINSKKLANIRYYKNII